MVMWRDWENPPRGPEQKGKEGEKKGERFQNEKENVGACREKEKTLSREQDYKRGTENFARAIKREGITR